MDINSVSIRGWLYPAMHPMQRYKLTLSYRGTRYHGWQTQGVPQYYKGPAPADGEGIPTVQETLARAVTSVVRHPINLAGSSRTDARVHAKGQIVVFDTDQLQIPREGMRRAINAALPEDITVRAIDPVEAEFNPVTWAASKRYQYGIWNRPDRPTFFGDLVWHRWQELDIAAMQNAARRLKGQHDFTSFARPGHGRDSAVREVLSCSVSVHPPLLVVGVEGTGFLWNMVRIMVGTLVEVGLGRHAPEAIDTMLAARDRRAAGATAPPHGLYLQWIKFRPAAVESPSVAFATS